MPRSTTVIGKKGEDMAVEYLQQAGYKILARNWRTRRCEIDVVAMKDSAVYFIEVKYRSRADQGKGLDYITPQKLLQMKFAADIWVARHSWRGMYSLSAIGVDGRSGKVEIKEVI